LCTIDVWREKRGYIHVKGRRNESALDFLIRGVLGLGDTQSGLDGIDTLVGEAGDFDIGTDFDGLGSQPLADIRLELFGRFLGGELDAVPYIGVASQKY